MRPELSAILDKCASKDQLAWIKGATWLDQNLTNRSFIRHPGKTLSAFEHPEVGVCNSILLVKNMRSLLTRLERRRNIRGIVGSNAVAHAVEE
jgi:hypothetical protein